jgi:hypothetical protein
MDRDYCEHGLAERRRTASASAASLVISPSNMAHLSGCPHKGDDPDYRRWAELETPRAWERLGNGEECAPPMAVISSPSQVPGLRRSRPVVNRGGQTADDT